MTDGTLFFGIAMCIVSLGILYLFYHCGRWYKTNSDREERYSLFEIAMLNKKAKEKGINLDKERAKLRTMAQMNKRRSFRNELELEIIEEIFGKDEDDD